MAHFRSFLSGFVVAHSLSSATTVTNNSRMALTPGPKKGAVYKAAIDRAHWYNLCKRFSDNKTRYASRQTNFLRHSDSGEQVDVSDKNRFSGWMKKYLAGQLKSEERGGKQRDRKGMYDEVADKLVCYLNLRE